MPIGGLFWTQQKPVGFIKCGPHSSPERLSAFQGHVWFRLSSELIRDGVQWYILVNTTMSLPIPYKAVSVYFMSRASVRFSRRFLSDAVTTAYKYARVGQNSTDNWFLVRTVSRSCCSFTNVETTDKIALFLPFKSNATFCKLNLLSEPIQFQINFWSTRRWTIYGHWVVLSVVGHRQKPVELSNHKCHKQFFRSL
jgi:hypothetical protein